VNTKNLGTQHTSALFCCDAPEMSFARRAQHCSAVTHQRCHLHDEPKSSQVNPARFTCSTKLLLQSPMHHSNDSLSCRCITKTYYILRSCTQHVPCYSALMPSPAPCRASCLKHQIILVVDRHPTRCARTGTQTFNPEDPVSGFSGIPRNMTGMATVMKRAGYSTHQAGKW
jgi:hypothetical protein